MHFEDYKYYRLRYYGYYHHHSQSSYYSEYSARTSYDIDIESQTKKEQKAKEIKANIPKRALMLEETSGDILSLPQLPTVLWNVIAEYEGGVESSLLGKEQDTNMDTFWSCCCTIM